MTDTFTPEQDAYYGAARRFHELTPADSGTTTLVVVHLPQEQGGPRTGRLAWVDRRTATPQWYLVIPDARFGEAMLCLAHVPGDTLVTFGLAGT